MNFIVIILLLVVVIGSFLFFYVTVYNELQHYKSRIEISENSIDDLLRDKYDVIISFEGEIKKVCPDKNYMKEYTTLKDKRVTNYEIDRKLIEATNLIVELTYDFEKFNNKSVKEKLRRIREIDEGLTASKNFYNKYTSDINTIIRVFPKNLVAKNHKFKIKPFFDNKNMQDAIIDDFKL